MEAASRNVVRLECLALELLKSDPEHPPTDLPEAEDEVRDGRNRIRCPKCSWEPGRHDRWSCVCLHSWNTFDTRGVCPACQYQWRDTQCLRCAKWSHHDEWYEGASEPRA